MSMNSEAVTLLYSQGSFDAYPRELSISPLLPLDTSALEGLSRNIRGFSVQNSQTLAGAAPGSSVCTLRSTVTLVSLLWNIVIITSFTDHLFSWMPAASDVPTRYGGSE